MAERKLNSGQLLDSKAPIPLVRPKIASSCTLEEVDFSYTYTQAVHKTIRRETGGAGMDTVETEDYEEEKTKKVSLKLFSNTGDEDVEHFFEAFFGMQKVLAMVWRTASSNMNNDATILFEAIETMFTGPAERAWKLDV